MQSLGTCLWFDGQAEEAAKLYTSLFKNSQIGKTTRYSESSAKVSGQKAGSTMTVEFEIDGLKILGLNGGPLFKFSPSFSFFVWCKSEADVDRLWKGLSAGGEVRMGLDKYPWAQKYGWTNDRFGVEWQIMLSDQREGIAPAFLFTDSLYGKGQEAIDFYMSAFANSKVETMARDEKTKTVMHAIFKLAGQDLVLMEGEGKHGHQFTHAFSLVVTCDTQSEIDKVWETLKSGGGSEEPCGWLKDKFGVSWQIVPSALGKWMSDPVKSEKVMAALLKMKKLDMKTLEQAYVQ